MFCPNCGAQVEENAVCCPYCGVQVGGANPQTGGQNYTQAQPVMTPAAGLFTQIFSSKMFMIICMLASVSVGASIISKSFPIIEGLFIIAGWMLYSAAKKSNVPGYGTSLRMMSGLSTAVWVLNWIAVGSCALLGVIFLFSGSVLESAMNILQESGWMFNLSSSLINLGSILIGLILIVAAGVITVLNIYAYGNFRICAKSFVSSYMTGQVMIDKLSTVKTWLLVLGIINGLSALSSITVGFFAFIGSGCSAAVYFCVYIWINELDTKFGVR